MLRSRKALYIVLLVLGVVVFIVTFAITDSWWQALVFFVGFLLLSVVISSPGLLIPERIFRGGSSSRRLLGGRSTGKDSDVNDKDTYLESMNSMLTEFSTQPGVTTEDVHWMAEYTRLMKEVGELVYGVHESVESRDQSRQLRSFRKVVNDLPRLINRFNDIPEDLLILRNKKALGRQSRGMDLYFMACSDFAEAIETRNGGLAGQAALKIREALSLMDIIDKPKQVRMKK